MIKKKTSNPGKKKLVVLELKRTKITVPQKASSQNVFWEKLKKKSSVSSIKKLNWKIVKIITSEGEYIPGKNSEVLLVSYTSEKNKKAKNKLIAVK